MSGSFTPGPWVIIPAAPYDGDDEALEGSFATFASIEGADGNPVCAFGDSYGSGTMYENEADYRLIAAAPDGLAANQEALDFITAYFGPAASDDPEGWSEPDAYEVATKLRAAIAKATDPSQSGRAS